MRAPAKGQPSKAPHANQKIPSTIPTPPFMSMNAENPSIEVYMAKLDGRYAGAA
jgi:hypothetical protein